MFYIFSFYEVQSVYMITMRIVVFMIDFVEDSLEDKKTSSIGVNVDAPHIVLEVLNTKWVVGYVSLWKSKLTIHVEQ